MPTVTLAKFKLVGEMARSSGAEDETPVPVSVTVAGEFSAVLVTVNLPVTAPAAVGLNCVFRGRF